MFKTVIIYCNYGRLGNRLHTHTNALAWCINNGYGLLNLSFKPYTQHFHANNNCFGYIFNLSTSLSFKLLQISFIQSLLENLCRSNKWLKRLSWFVETIDRDDCTSLTEKELTKSISRSNKLKIIRSWDINCPVSLLKHKYTVKKILAPNLRSKFRAESVIQELRCEYSTLIGVHARRGDYNDYLGGIHYHSWENYKKWISETKILFEDQMIKTVGFLLCSDEHPTFDTFKSLPVHFIPQPEMICDLHALSLCDYNIGPPSSFGTWISWYGNVPRLVIQKGTKVLSLNQFRVSDSC
jgi:hypothetical protein